MNERNRRRLAWAIFALAALAAGAGIAMLASGHATETALDDKFLAEHGIRHWVIVRDRPRVERIHHVVVDLADPHVGLDVVPSDKPPDPATGQLTPPKKLAECTGTAVFINANPWTTLAGSPQGAWTEDQPVRMLGMVVAGGVVRSPPSSYNCGFYVDRAGRAHIGNPDNVAEVREGIAGFLRLIDSGRILPVAKPGEKPQPRTALGLDATGRYLTILVVDGRQERFSMGMTYSELADYMSSLGCFDAVNLDGGGSSILLLAGAKGTLRVVSSPCDPPARPIPVGLAVRLNPR